MLTFPQIHHTTCHAEAGISANTLASRLENKGRESSSGTPGVSVSTPACLTPPRTFQPRASLSTSPVRTSGGKRKAEDDDPSLGDTSPTKKIEVSERRFMVNIAFFRIRTLHSIVEDPIIQCNQFKPAS